MEKFITKAHLDDALDTLSTLISYPSVLDEEATTTPFGQDIQDCLEVTLDFFKKEGFETFIDPDGYYGYAEIGEGDLFAVLCHLDVVPAGDPSKWSVDPFKAEIKNDAIYGRGTQDNKGPAIASYYGLKAVLDKGYQLKHKIRYIFGTDEENLWRCMNKYCEEQPVAKMGFAPDSKFPLNFAEKGLLQFNLKGTGQTDFVLEGGKALNVVPELATYQGTKVADVVSELETLGYKFESNTSTVKVFGKATHSKDAPIGINAITRLAEALHSLYPDNKALELLGGVIKGDANGVSAIGEVKDEPSGLMTMNIAKVTMNADETTISVDIRYPVTLEKEDLVAKLETLATKYDLVYEEYDYLAPLYVPVDSELVSTLLAAYRDVSGDTESAPIASGGATYARTMPNCVAFGAMFEDTVELFHQIDECWTFNDMERAMDVYAEAFYRLCVTK
ncbi:M20 family metallopeptidase [Vagococcus zengguangii]|uniref:Sapep family Mn(2+)-dependent dipeptidase n=1 Tax=Vagococcus zengguangii TaxID=2571750 RepID=A0A4D7CQD2_9ENTE|nr:M20 family metallopeptidase [Vagococcus zengguangii]QCI86308.1 Sapep family Mn(2+)-dependent dipeptidase [Vagococcus zengguangii]